MAETRDFGRLFLHRMSYPSTDFPVCERGDTQETSYPFRHAKSLVVRLPLSTRALVIGWWGKPQDEEEALLRAVSLGEKRSYVQEGEAFTEYLESPTESAKSIHD